MDVSTPQRSVLNLGFPGLVCIVQQEPVMILEVSTVPVMSMYNMYCTCYVHVQCVLYLLCPCTMCSVPVMSMYNVYCTCYFHVQCVLYLLFPCTMCTVPVMSLYCSRLLSCLLSENMGSCTHRYKINIVYRNRMMIS
jgi:hypothetical protein